MLNVDVHIFVLQCSTLFWKVDVFALKRDGVHVVVHSFVCFYYGPTIASPVCDVCDVVSCACVSELNRL